MLIYIDEVEVGVTPGHPTNGILVSVVKLGVAVSKLFYVDKGLAETLAKLGI